MKKGNVYNFRGRSVRIVQFNEKRGRAEVTEIGGVNPFWVNVIELKS